MNANSFVDNAVVKFYIGESEEVANQDESANQEKPCYEEECLLGLQKILTERLFNQLIHLLGNVGFDGPYSIVGLNELINKVVNQVLHFSEDEPYGVRGANMIVMLERPLQTRSFARKSSVLSTTSSTSSTYDHFSDDSRHETDLETLGHIKMCIKTVSPTLLTTKLYFGSNYHFY